MPPAVTDFLQGRAPRRANPALPDLADFDNWTANERIEFADDRKPDLRAWKDLAAHAEQYLKPAWARTRKDGGGALPVSAQARAALDPLLVTEFWQAVAPARWIEDERRRFLPWGPLRTTLCWGVRGDESLRTQATPPTLETAAALACAPAAVEQAEALADEVCRRLEVWGGARPTRFVWTVSYDAVAQHWITLLDQVALLARLSKDLLLGRSSGLLREPTRWSDTGNLLLAAHAWRDAAALDERTPTAPLPVGADPSFDVLRARMRAAGLSFGSAPDPFTPLLALLALGYDLLGAGSEEPVLVLRRAHLRPLSAPTFEALHKGVQARLEGWLEPIDTSPKIEALRQDDLAYGQRLRRAGTPRPRTQRVAWARLVDGSWGLLVPDNDGGNGFTLRTREHRVSAFAEALLGMTLAEAAEFAAERDARGVRCYPGAIGFERAV